MSSFIAQQLSFLGQHMLISSFILVCVGLTIWTMEKRNIDTGEKSQYKEHFMANRMNKVDPKGNGH